MDITTAELLRYLGFDPVTEGQDIAANVNVHVYQSNNIDLHYTLIDVKDEKIHSPNLTIVFKGCTQPLGLVKMLREGMMELMVNLPITIQDQSQIVTHQHNDLTAVVCLDGAAGFRETLVKAKRAKIRLS